MQIRKIAVVAACGLAMSLAAAGCVKGGDKGKAPAGGGEGTQSSAPAKPADAPKAASAGDADWKAGKMPKSVTEGTPKAGGTAVVQMYSEPPSLQHITESDWWSARITGHHLYEMLIGYDNYDDPDYKHVPELAERWEISDDHLTYTFFLRKGVKWHDGKPFTAKDVIATYDKVQDENTKAAHWRAYTEELESYKALDDHTVQFKWKAPYFLAMDTPFADMPIMPAHLIEPMTPQQFNEAATNPLKRSPVGTGPFKFGAWETGQKIEFVRNDDYWGPKAHLERVIFRIVKDPTVALQLAEKGEIDVVTRILAADWVKLTDNQKLKSKYNRSKYYDSNYAWIGWNTKRPFFADKKVRNAMTRLINRPSILKNMMHGIYMPSTCHFYYASKACDRELKQPPFDPNAAVKLLDEAGWKDTDNDGVRDKDGVPFKFTFMIPASSVDAERMGTKMKEDFKKAGIDMGLQKVEWSAFTKRLREKAFDSCTLLWGGGPRGDPTQIWHSVSIDGGSNYISYSNKRLDELMEKARVEFDADKRNAMYREFGQILHDEQPYTWMYTRPRMSLVAQRLKGVRESINYWQYEDWWVQE